MTDHARPADRLRALERPYWLPLIWASVRYALGAVMLGACLFGLFFTLYLLGSLPR